jgi:hypothetical protein
LWLTGGGSQNPPPDLFLSTGISDSKSRPKENTVPLASAAQQKNNVLTWHPKTA